jgi:hypothetical protein
VQTTFSTSHSRCHGSTTLAVGSVPMRSVPMMWRDADACPSALPSPSSPGSGGEWATIVQSAPAAYMISCNFGA